jgi:hypothetical protein
MKIGSVVQLNQSNTKDNWVVADIRPSAYKGNELLLKHEDELDCAGGWMPEGCVKESDINHRDRAFLLAAFAGTKRGREIVRAVTQ